MLRMFAVSFVFGFLSVGLLLLCLAFRLAIIADVREWGSFSIGGGVFAILDYERTPAGTETAIGVGTFAISVLAGTLNAVAGAILWSRAPDRR
jgi:ABC-type uncharacterized transport system permease subunit